MCNRARPPFVLVVEAGTLELTQIVLLTQQFFEIAATRKRRLRKSSERLLQSYVPRSQDHFMLSQQIYVNSVLGCVLHSSHFWQCSCTPLLEPEIATAAGYSAIDRVHCTSVGNPAAVGLRPVYIGLDGISCSVGWHDCRLCAFGAHRKKEGSTFHKMWLSN